MRMKLLAVAALAIAVTAPFAAYAAPGSGAQIAEERTATSPLVDLVPAYAAQPAGVSTVDRGGKLELLPAAVSPGAAAGASLEAARVARGSADRHAIVWHLLL